MPNDTADEGQVVSTQEVMVVEDERIPSHYRTAVLSSRSLVMVLGNRLFSVVLYSLAQQMFTRQSLETQTLGAAVAVLANITNVIRESLRHINNETSEIYAKIKNREAQHAQGEGADDTDAFCELRVFFQVAHLAVLPLSVVLLIAQQGYVSFLPALGRSAEVTRIMRWVPLINWVNSTTMLVFTVESNFAYGMRHLLPMMLSFCGGGFVIFLSYLGIFELTHTIYGFFLASFLQSIFISLSYLVYLNHKMPQLQLPRCLFSTEDFLPRFMHSTQIIRKGLQTAGVYFFETLFGALVVSLMEGESELGAFQSMLLFLVISMSSGIGIESNMTSMVRGVRSKQIVLRNICHQLLQLSLLSGTFILAIYGFRDKVTAQLVAPTAENASVTEIVNENLVLMSAIFGAYCLRSVGRGVVLAFRDGTAFGERCNHASVLINIFGSFTYFFLGFLLDKLDHRGAHGYVLSLNISAYLVALGQLFLAACLVQRLPVLPRVQHKPAPLRAYPRVLFPVRESEGMQNNHALSYLNPR